VFEVGLCLPGIPHVSHTPSQRWHLMIAHPRPLIDVFAMIPDCRQPRGTRPPFAAIFALACCAILCGARSDSAIAAWGRHDGVQRVQALGCTHAPPCAATLPPIFRHVNRDEVEAHLSAWADQVVESLPPGPETPEIAIALDGKTLRGSNRQGAPGLHLFSALAHHGGVTLAQQAVDHKTNESTAVELLVQCLVLEGRIGTLDALLTPRHVAQTIVDKGGDYGMIVKEHQPQLRAAIELVFTLPPGGDRQATAQTVDLGHGRIAQRHLTTRAALVGYSAGPGLAQVFALGRHVRFPKTGKERVEVVYGVTRLHSERATPERLLALVRGQWQMENKSHWVRDGTFDEDRSQVRCGNMPQVMAALRHTAIGLLRYAGYANIAAAGRRLAAPPLQAWALIGIALEN
jgi:predicted transposase YbfD/YdcC